MSHWDEIRRQARTKRAAALREAEEDPSAESLLAAAERLTSIERIGLPAGDSLLDGADATLDHGMKRVWFNREVEPRLARFYQAHEYAHLWLHPERENQPEFNLDPEAIEEPLPVGVNRVEGYGPEERREREANVFARNSCFRLTSCVPGTRPIRPAQATSQRDWGFPRRWFYSRWRGHCSRQKSPLPTYHLAKRTNARWTPASRKLPTRHEGHCY